MSVFAVVTSWVTLAICAPVGAVTIWRALEKYIIEKRDRARAKLITSVYQEILSKHFPGVCIMSRGYGDYLSISAYMIPDDRQGEFMEYLLNDLTPQLEARGLEFHGVMPTSVSATKKYYPDLYAEFTCDNKTCHA